ncbi:MAG: hypothetical protein HYW26_06065 [Candidatus Aenigmarchaeota archaeon]|nr:hypothetical protein [Candidatus Aenigmarchaeota archaeon]
METNDGSLDYHIGVKPNASVHKFESPSEKPEAFIKALTIYFASLPKSDYETLLNRLKDAGMVEYNESEFLRR